MSRASGRDRATRRMADAAAGQPPGPAPGPFAGTPLPPAVLLRHTIGLESLLRELVELTGSEHAWTLRVLRRNVEVALLCPETLESAQNQVDFIEALADAAWDEADAGLRLGLPPLTSPLETQAREERRLALVARLDQLAGHLWTQVERWLEPEAGPESPG